MHAKIRRTRAQALLKHTDASLKDARGNPTPTAVQERHRPQLGIDERDRNTIGHRHRQQNTGRRADVTVGVRAHVESGQLLGVEAHGSTVHLVAVHDPHGASRATQCLPASHHLARPTVAEQREVKGLGGGTNTGDALD
jgi:hypothetical protein